jgi:hypothetical protein
MRQSGDAMTRSHFWIAGPLLLGALTGLFLVARVQAGPERVAFPANYAQGVRWLVVDRADRKEFHEHYVTPAAIAAARNGAVMPNGTVFTVVRYAALLDAQGDPRRGTDGHYLKGEIVGYAVMEKRAGWGDEYPDSVRNGEWEYQVFTPQKAPNTSMKLGACFGCHKAEGRTISSMPTTSLPRRCGSVRSEASRHTEHQRSRPT